MNLSGRRNARRSFCLARAHFDKCDQHVQYLMKMHGALYHDLHHSANMGNFGSGLDIFDVMAGSRVYSGAEAEVPLSRKEASARPKAS